MSNTQSLLDLSNSQSLRGTVERVVFHNEDNGYSVLKLKIKGKADLVTLVGYIATPQPGVIIEAKGSWIVDSRFGRQFKMESFVSLLPSSAEGIRHYLGSGLIKGIRDGLAKRIVEAFGEDTFNVLDEEPERLSTVKGITPLMVANIKKAWEEHQGVRELIIFLQPHGISTSLSMRIYKHYGNSSFSIVKENPYRLAMDIHGIGFITADDIAMKLGFKSDSLIRAEAGLLYVLQKMTEDGHIFVPKNILLDQASSMLKVDHEILEKGLESLTFGERIVIEPLEDNDNEIIAIYLSRFHHYEVKISFYLQRLLKSPKSVHFTEQKELLKNVLGMLPIELAEEQIEAAKKSLEEKVVVITGGPGTGKTTVINAIIKLFQTKKAKILLAAPTGRAAKRMSETSGLEAKTIHRLLEYSPMEDGFAKNENSPLACGLLIVDEASMLDTLLMYHLLKAIPVGATVIFVGDVNQLPSVGPGNILKDIINSSTVKVVRLTEIFRQAASSSIIINAHKINLGEVPYLSPPVDGLSDFYFIRQDEPEQCAEMVVRLVKDHIPRRFKFNSIDDIQVLTPMHKGSAGVAALNQMLQNSLNPNKEKIQRGDKQFKLDDKVMQLRNNYDKDVFNGDIGRICYIDHENKELTVRYDDKNTLYSFDELDEITPAYAISVHKSQGSEYPAVVIPVLTQHYVLLQRNLIYTAVTRGKRLVILVGSAKALHIAVGNNKMEHRYTWLEKRLQGTSKYGI